MNKTLVHCEKLKCTGVQMCTDRQDFKKIKSIRIFLRFIKSSVQTVRIVFQMYDSGLLQSVQV